jgi:hypothetical protein
MKRLVFPGVFVFMLLSVSIAHATDVNCSGGEMHLDTIINQMLGPPDVIQNCNDLASFEIECADVGWWREWDGYLAITATFAGYDQKLYWQNDDHPSGVHVLTASTDGVVDHGVNLWITTGENNPLFYFKDESWQGGTLKGTWFSRDSLNSDGQRHMVVYRFGNDTFICGFEDISIPGADEDYQDLVFMIEHAAPSCIPVVRNIPDQAVRARDPFDAFDLDDYILPGDYDIDQDVSWQASPGNDVFASINPSTREVTITYTYDWTGGESLTFTATAGNHSFDSDPVFFQVMEPDAPVVHDIPNQVIVKGESFQAIHLDNYVDPPPNYDLSEIMWTTSGGNNISVAIDANRVATLSYTPSWSGREVITFEGEINPSGSTSAVFTVLSAAPGSGGGGSAACVGGTAQPVNKFDLLAPWIAVMILVVAGVASAVIWKRRGHTPLR